MISGIKRKSGYGLSGLSNKCLDSKRVISYTFGKYLEISMEFTAKSRIENKSKKIEFDIENFKSTLNKVRNLPRSLKYHSWHCPEMPLVLKHTWHFLGSATRGSFLIQTKVLQWVS